MRRAKNLDTFAGRLTRNVGAQIKSWRRTRNMTTEQLSKATAALGHEIPRSVITNLENDRRDYVSIAEILLIAAALNVPPVLFIAPVGVVESEEILPKVERSPWRSRGWLMGAVPLAYEGFKVTEWSRATVAVKMYDKHRLLVRSYEQAKLRLQELDNDHLDQHPDGEWPEEEPEQRNRIRSLMLRQLASYLEQIRKHRQNIEQEGLVLPALPPEVEADLSAPASVFNFDDPVMG